MRVVITGTIPGRFVYPDNNFSNFCWESWGNVWSLIDGVDCEFISHNDLIEEPELFDDIDIFMATMDLEEVLNHAFGKCFVIMVEHGSGHKIDIMVDVQERVKFIEHINKADLILNSTHGGKDYMSLYTDTPILDIPVPIDLDVFYPRKIDKFDDFTICIGETIDSAHSDRPLQYQAISIAKHVGAKISTSLNPDFSITKQDVFDLTGIPESDILFYPHGSMLEMSRGYMARSHISMMVSQRPTFGRFTYISSAIGIPCIASKFMMYEKINDELTFGYMDISEIINTVIKLRDDVDFYNHCQSKSLDNIKQMSNSAIAVRICNEILPFYKNNSNKNYYMKWQNGTDLDFKIIEESGGGIKQFRTERSLR